MNIDDYQRLAGETAIYPGRGGTLGAIYNALALGEAGEIQGKVSKLIRDDAIIDTVKTTEAWQDEDYYFGDIPDHKRAELKKELGDLLWHMAMLAHDLGYSMSEIAQANLDKLADRSKRGVLGGSGDNR